VVSTTDYNGPANGDDKATSVALDGSRNVVVVGYEGIALLDHNWQVRKYDATLTTLLASTEYSGPGTSDDKPTSVIVDGSGNIVVAGYETDVSGYTTWLLRKYDATLTTVLGSTAYDGPVFLAGVLTSDQSVAVDGSGNVVVAGYEWGSTGWLNWRVRKYDPTLTVLLGSIDYNGPADDRDGALSAVTNGSGNVIVAGYETGSSGTTIWLVRKYDATLTTVLASTQYVGAAPGIAGATAVAVDPLGDVFVTGSEWVASGINWRIIRYSFCPSPAGPVTPPPSTTGIAVYPNPFIRSAAVRTTVKFIGVDPAGTVEIYTLRGFRAWSGKADAAGRLEWDGRNSAGSLVVSGNYLWVAIHDGRPHRGTLIIE